MKHFRLFSALLSFLLTLALMVSATASPALLPSYDLEASPFSIQLQADLQVLMPFDETRTGWLNSLLKYTTMEIAFSESENTRWERLTLQVDHSSVLQLVQSEDGDQSHISTDLSPDSSYLAQNGQNALELLLGSSGSVNLFGLTGNELSLFEDGLTMLTTLIQTKQDAFAIKKKSESVTGYGKTQLVYTLTLQDSEAGKLSELLLNACPSGSLKEKLSLLTFSGKQTLTLLVTNEGSIHKITYSGRCGTGAEHMHRVSLTWKLNHEDALTQDALTLKAPAVSGSDTCELSFKQTMKTVQDDVSEELSFSWTDQQDGVKHSLSGDASLKRTDSSEGSSALSGSLVLNNKQGSNARQKLTLAPALTFSSDILQGSVAFELKEDSDTTLKGSVQISAAPCEDFSQSLWAPSVSLEAMSEDELLTLRQQLMDQAATALVAHWVMLPSEDTLYLSQDLPEDVWQQIAFAAMALTEEEE